MDERLCEFIEHAWQRGDPRVWSTNARAATVCPPCGACTTASGKNQILSPATPLPPTFLLALVGAALRGSDLRMAVALMVASDGLLCTGEMLVTQALYFVIPKRPGPIVLTLPVTKSATSVLSRVRHAERSTVAPIFGSIVAVTPLLRNEYDCFPIGKGTREQGTRIFVGNFAFCFFS